MLFVYYLPPVRSEAIFNTVYTKATIKTPAPTPAIVPAPIAAALLATEGIAVVTGAVATVVVVLNIICICKYNFCSSRTNLPGSR